MAPLIRSLIIKREGLIFITTRNGFFYNIKKYKMLYIIMIPGLLFFLIFHYIPMYGVIIAFQHFRPVSGIRGMIIDPNWVGLKNFKDFFGSFYATRVITNTILISLYRLLWGFPTPIILALLLNEVYNRKFKKIVQTISYLPHFLSWVIVSSIFATLLARNGMFNTLITRFGLEPISFLSQARYFRTIIVASGIWNGVGFGSIIYLAALSGVSPELYESATIDGANRLHRMIYISIPSIAHIIIIMLILSIGNILNAGFEQILLMYSPAVYSVGDIIDTFVYREGLIGARFSYGAAVGLFKGIVGMFIIIGTNYLVKKYDTSYGLW